jgi:hypothetical protein
MNYGSHTRCTIADVGDIIVAYDQTYKVTSFDDYGQAVCENLNPDCMYRDEYRTFDDLDIDKVIKGNDPILFIMEGI